jgi:hypothetical protein
MEVIATKKGYFGKLREPGATFDVPDKSTASWFEPVEKPKSDDKPEKADKSEKPKSDGKV